MNLFRKRKPKFRISARGDHEWRLDGKLHRDDGPAVERANGTKAWYRNGQLHREDGPAVERADGSMVWWNEGKRIASVTAKAAADEIVAREEDREFNKKRATEKALGAIRQGLPHPIAVSRPIRFKN